MSEPREERKTVRTFAAASFLNDMGSDMIAPVWPLFVTSLGANMAVLGFIDGLGEALVSISQAVSGHISDRIRKRKVFIWLGYLFAALSRAGYALSTAWQALIPFRILDRAGKMRGAPRDAMIADSSSGSNRGGHFGLLRAMDNLGAVCGILLCFWLVERIGFRNLFLLAALPSVVAVLLIVAAIREGSAGEVRLYKGVRLSDLDRNLQLFILLSSFFALGSFSYSFLLIYSKNVGFEIAFVPVFYLLFTAVAFLSSLPFGKLSDRVGRKSVLFVSFVLWGLVCLLLTGFESAWAVFAAFVAYGLHRGAIDTVQKAFVSELGPEAYRASVLGGFQMVVGLCALPASLVAGILWDSVHMYAPFYFSLGLTVLSLILLLFVKEKERALR